MGRAANRWSCAGRSRWGVPDGTPLELEPGTLGQVTQALGSNSRCWSKASWCD